MGNTVLKLMEEVDNWIELQRDVDKDFLMPVEDVFSITGRGTVATGRIETGLQTLVMKLISSEWVLKNSVNYWS